MRPTRIEIAFLLLILPAIISCGGTSGSKEASSESNDEIIQQFLIGAVVEKTPLNSSVQFDIITQYENLLSLALTDEVLSVYSVV